jgi:hypothetical protein
MHYRRFVESVKFIPKKIFTFGAFMGLKLLFAPAKIAAGTEHTETYLKTLIL